MIQTIDSIEIFKEPYTFGVVDNFLPNDIIKGLLELMPGGRKKERNFAFKMGRPGREIPTDRTTTEGQDYYNFKNVIGDFCDLCNEDSFKIPILEKIGFDQDNYVLRSPKRLLNSLSDAYTSIEYRGYYCGHEHKPHIDIPVKLLSIVVYIYPENQGKYLTNHLGTTIYKPNQEIDIDSEYNLEWESSEKYSYHGSVDWKVNRALIFSPSKTTWHSYHCPPYLKQTRRVTLLINIEAV